MPRKNTKPRKKTTPTEAFIQDHLTEQIKTSDEYRKRFEQAKDPEVVVEFIRRNPFVLKEEWVIDIVISWLQTGAISLIKRAFLPRKGERPNEYEKAALDFFLTERIDRLVAQGMTKTEAFQSVKPLSNLHLDPLTIRNIYYATKKKKARIYIEKTPKGFRITAS